MRLLSVQPPYRITMMEHIKLNDNLYVQSYENELILHLPDDEYLKIEEKSFLLDLLYEIKKSGSLGAEGVYKQLAKAHQITYEEFTETLQTLLDNNILKLKHHYTHQLSERELTKYDRQIKSFATLPGNHVNDGIRFQEKIKNANVGILGVGGVGSYVAYGLASMGIGKLTLIDHDHIELSNTSRQMLYTESDIGKQKIDVAQEKLKAVQPSINITAINKRVTNSTDLIPHLNDLDLLVLCADTPRGRIVYIVDEACQNQNCPFLFGLPSFNQIICGPLIIPGKTRSYKEIFPNIAELEHAKLSQDEKEKTDSINAGLVATIIDPYNAIAGKLVVLEIIKFLTEFAPCQLVNRVFNFNTNTLTSSITEV